MAEHEKHEEGSEASHGAGHGGGHGGAHAGGAHEEHEGAPEWLISFADNVALMMGFFVILLAMNMAEKSVGGGKGERGKGGEADSLDFVIAIRQAFNPIDMSSENPAEAALRKRIRERAESQRSRQPEDPGQGHESNAIRDTQISTLGGTVQFDDDSSTVAPAQVQRIETIAGKLKGIRFIIEVRGHASPSETLRNPEKGMLLGYSRALAVARVLVAQGLQWEQLRIVACGDNERKVARDYSEADRQNQRVNIVPTSEPAPDYAAPAEAKAAESPH